MSNSSLNKADVASSEDQSAPPRRSTLLQAADIPKASPEALHLLKSIGTVTNCFTILSYFCYTFFSQIKCKSWNWTWAKISQQ